MNFFIRYQLHLYFSSNQFLGEVLSSQIEEDIRKKVVRLYRIMCPLSQMPHLRPRGTFTTLTPDRLDSVKAGLAWCRAMVEVIMYPKRSSTRRGTPFYPGAPAAQSDRCRKQA